MAATPLRPRKPVRRAGLATPRAQQRPGRREAACQAKQVNSRPRKASTSVLPARAGLDRGAPSSKRVSYSRLSRGAANRGQRPSWSLSLNSDPR